MEKINIAIDGPAGAGKSTIAKLAAEKLKFIYVDTGAMYRAMALYCIRNKVSADDEESVARICKEADVTIEYVDGEQHVLLNGENVNGYIRTEEVSQMTSAVSVYKEVREKLLSLQRNIAANNNVIMDGRDIGSNVLPEAELKIYLTASVQTRAKRRYLEQIEKGFDVKIEEIEEEIEKRDYRDMHRECAPLKIAEGAEILDTSDMSIDEVVQTILCMVEKIRSN
ncbi:MAG: (d)CMP kinase [Lachnospiraceae bacterium]|nr:(d)CMP kinase [Lachnospiraceae bacterium]